MISSQDLDHRDPLRLIADTLPLVGRRDPDSPQVANLVGLAGRGDVNALLCWSGHALRPHVGLMLLLHSSGMDRVQYSPEECFRCNWLEYPCDGL